MEQELVRHPGQILFIIFAKVCRFLIEELYLFGIPLCWVPGPCFAFHDIVNRVKYFNIVP